MSKYSGEHTLEQLFQNENIKADRFGMAAISYIFKAFGDTLRSQEYWPWSEKVNLPWESSKGTDYDLTIAIELLNEAINRIDESTDVLIKTTNSGNINDLKRQLSNLKTKEERLNNYIKQANDLVEEIDTKSNNI